MPKDSVPTKQAILKAGFQLFFARGYARVSMDDIADKAGLTKRTLYYHFDSKDALVGAVLQNQNAQTLQEFEKLIDPEALTPVEFSDSFFEKLALWSTSPGWKGSGYTRLVFELADLPGHPARSAAAIHKKALENWLSQQLQMRRADDFQKKAQSIAVLLEGAMTLTLIHSNSDYIKVAQESARMVLR